MDQTIPATWSPSPDCLASTDLWEWQKLETAAYVLGGPVETSSCYPPEYTGVATVNYQATACPTGFSQACVGADLATCCPTAYSFTCNTYTGYAYLDATTFPCTSHWPAEGLTTTITLTYAQLGSWAQSVASYTVTRASDSSTVTLTTSGWFTTTEVVSAGGTLYAMAVAIRTPVSVSRLFAWLRNADEDQIDVGHDIKHYEQYDRVSFCYTRVFQLRLDSDRGGRSQ